MEDPVEARPVEDVAVGEQWVVTGGEHDHLIRNATITVTAGTATPPAAA